MNKTVFTFVIVICAVALIASAQSFRDSRKSEEHTKWVSDSLREMQMIKVGKTRADLLEVFTTEGGISNALHRTYVYSKCQYIKVDVEFEVVGRDAEKRVLLEESDKDIIKSISKPYLEWNISD